MDMSCVEVTWFADNLLLEFAQVEFVAVLATLLMKYKVVPAAKEEVSEDIARDEMQKLIAGSTARMVVNLSEPEKLWIKLVKR